MRFEPLHWRLGGELFLKTNFPLKVVIAGGVVTPPSASYLQPAFRHTMDRIVNRYRGNLAHKKTPLHRTLQQVCA